MALGDLIGKLFGGGGAKAAAPAAEPVEYNGFTILPAPIAEGGQFRTAGSIQREREGQLQSVRFIRADNTADRTAAIEHSIHKARQIIDEQGAGIFDREMA